MFLQFFHFKTSSEARHWVPNVLRTVVTNGAIDLKWVLIPILFIDTVKLGVVNFIIYRNNLNSN